MSFEWAKDPLIGDVITVKGMTVRCIWMKKHDSCGDCFLFGKACNEVICEEEKRQDGQDAMFEDYSEGSKNR